MTSPILAITSLSDKIIYANGNILKLENGDQISHPSRIHGIKTHENYILLFGETSVSIYEYSNNINFKTIPFKFKCDRKPILNKINTYLIYYKNFNKWILDAYFDEDPFILTIDGDVFDFNQNLIFKSHLQEITVGKFFSKEEVVIGARNKVYYRGNIYECKGRVFDLNVFKDTLIFSSEDRKVYVVDNKNIWSIQEYRNYIWKCGLYDEYVWTLGSDGHFKVYNKQNLVFNIYFGLKNLSSCVFIKNCFYMGCFDGNLYKISTRGTVILSVAKNFSQITFSDISNCYESTNILYNSIPNVIAFDTENDLTYLTDNHFLINEKFKTKLNFRPKLFSSNSDYMFAVEGHNLYQIDSEIRKTVKFDIVIKRIIVNENYVAVLFDNEVIYLCSKCLIEFKKIEVKNPTYCTKNYIATKNGCIIYGEMYKISKEKIIHMYEINGCCYVISDKKLYLIKPKNEIQKYENCCKSSIDNRENSVLRQTCKCIGDNILKYYKYDKPVSLSKNSKIELYFKKCPINTASKIIWNNGITLVSMTKGLSILNSGEILYKKGNILKSTKIELKKIEISVSEITSSIIFNGFLIQGCENGILVLRKIYDFKNIYDKLILEGEITKICNDDKFLYVSTKDGSIFVISIESQQLFIRCSIFVPYRVMSLDINEYVVASCSNGRVYVFNRFESQQKCVFCVELNRVVISIAQSDEFIYLADTFGYVIKIRKDELRLNNTEQTENFNFLKYSDLSSEEKETYKFRLENNLLGYVWNNFLKYSHNFIKVNNELIKTHENSIFSLIFNKKKLISAGDDHKIKITNDKGDTKSILSHCGQIRSLCMIDDILISIGTDLKLNVYFNEKRIMVKNFTVRNPSSVCAHFEQGVYTIFVQGDGFEVFKINNLELK